MLVCKDKDIRISDISPREPGSLNIEDKDIWVLTHECTWEQVTHSINKGHQPMYHVVTHSGKTIDCTYDHKFLTVKGMKTLRYILRHGTPLVMNDVSKLSFEKPIKTGRKSTEVVFKEIPGYPGYLASSEGKIFSVKAIGSQGKVLDYNHPHEMVPRLSKNGRYRVGLRLNDGRRHMEQVSRLVWMAFNDSFIPDGMVIDHIDTITTNDIPENLQCISSSENISRAYSMTRSSYTHGSINGASKLDVLKVANIKRELDICIPQQQIAHKYGVSQKQVSRIANGKAWGYIYLDRVFSCTSMGSQVVYDLSVNKNHSYVTRGEFISSNTTSGRLSSRNPNGQNIPKTMVNPDVKLQFIPPEGHLFFTYDYSQAELRILAHLAGEETMLEWFRTGKDIHLASACKKYHEDYDEILKIYEDEQNPQYKLWKKRRKQAKCINFGIVYEQSAPKLAESLSTPEEQVSVEEAQEFLDVFFSDFPKVKAFMDRQHKFMEDHGYVRSLFGRRRRCPKVYSESYREYLEALRQASNMPCQSAASDMALFASVLVYEKVRNGELPPMVEADTVHDSVYQFIQPQYITPDTVFKVWDICRNPSTKEYFGFSIDDVDMSMDFTIGRTMAEELPYVPGYDYKKMLSPDFNLDEYYEEHRKVKEISIKEYPEKFKEYFETSWRQRK